MTEAPISTLDSDEVSHDVVSGGNFAFYLRTLRKDPGKILRGVWDTVSEVSRFLLWPRFAVPFSPAVRVALVYQFLRAELNVPGGTTLLETVWFAYGAAQARSTATDWVEVGCFKGLSSARLSLLADRLDRKLSVFDTFEGLPGTDDQIYEAVDGGVSYRFELGSYLGRENEVRANIDRWGKGSCVNLVAGDASRTLLASPIQSVSFGFLDVDLVDSYRACFAGLAPRIVDGTLIVIHEACYRQIRELVLSGQYWNGLGLRAPEVEFVADKYGIRSCRNLAFLRWVGPPKTLLHQVNRPQ